MKLSNERYDASGAPTTFTMTAENDTDMDILNAIEQWVRAESKKLILEILMA